MDYRAFEQRLLDTIFTSDVQLTPATIAFLYKLSVQESSDLLQQAAVAGLLNIESDDDGNLLYTYPNRTKLPRDGSQPTASSADTQREMSAYRPEPAGITQLHRPPLSLVPDYDGDRHGSAQAEALPADLFHPHQAQQMVRCPFCHEQIAPGAKKCRYCHEYLDYALRDIQAIRGHGHGQGMNQVSVALQPATQSQALAQWTGTQSALLSLFMPGLGQMCSGRVPSGILWMMFTIMGYFCLIVPGFILHILCIINASRQPRQIT